MTSLLMTRRRITRDRVKDQVHFMLHTKIIGNSFFMNLDDVTKILVMIEKKLLLLLLLCKKLSGVE